MKHEAAEMRALYISNGRQIHIGYFVEGADHEGTVCPHPAVHRTDPAFSFIYDYVFALYFVYYAFEITVDTLLEFMRYRYGRIPSLIYEDNDFPLRDLVEKVSGLPLWIIPKEYRKYLPILYISENELIFDLSKKPSNTLPKRVKVSIISKADGASKTYKFPGLFG